MKNRIVVSIVCNTYNHGSYIRDALDGFIKQKTNFAYEVLVHDDASTDNTAEIIHEYEVKYPEIIKVIYQKENQYSQGINFVSKYQVPRIQGKYVAYCEGDDYWTDSEKLQKQFEAMESHPDVDMCAHAAMRQRAGDGKYIGLIAPGNSETIFDTGTVIKGGGDFVATNSLFFRSDLLTNPPAFRVKCPLDYALQIQGSMRGGMLYLPYNMSVYRVSVPGSWTERIGNSEFYISQAEMIKGMLDMVDMETRHQYSSVIQERKEQLDFAELESAGKYKELKKPQYRIIFKEKPLEWKVKYFIKSNLYFIYELYKKTKQKT